MFTLRRSPKRAVPVSTAACLSNGEVNLVKQRPPNQHAAGVGPRAAIRKLHQKEMSLQEKLDFVEQARLDALLGACRLSLHSWKSGVKCYIAFIGTFPSIAGSGRCEFMLVSDTLRGGRGRYFPPAADDLLVWSTMFRSAGTWSNYLSYIRTACLIVKADVAVFSDPAVLRAKSSIAKTGNFIQRPRMWLRRSVVTLRVVQYGVLRMFAVRHIVEKIKVWCDGWGGMFEWSRMGLLFLLTYAFLLRLPSEALPMTTGSNGLHMEGDSLVLVLPRRKNMPGGSRLVRTCWCAESKDTCPVHAVSELLQSCPDGTAIFKGITPAEALKCLRTCLEDLGVKDAASYRCHDFRRGHALDLQLSGASLWTILEAGQWRSPAFMQYLDMGRLETDLVVQAHCDESDDD